MQAKAYYTYFNKPKLVFLLFNIYFIVDMSVLPGFLCTKYTSCVYRGQKREKELYFLNLQLPMGELPCGCRDHRWLSVTKLVSSVQWSTTFG